jgi:hypothetical protein
MRLFLVFSALVLVAMPFTARAETCDAEFMDQMTGIAELEAQREVEVSQILIKKPASVLEYSCFGDMALDLGAKSVFGLNATGTISGVLSGLTTGCVSMADAWMAAKCANPTKEDLFPSLEDVTNGSLRSCG